MRMDVLRGRRRRQAKSSGHNHSVEPLESRRLLTVAATATFPTVFAAGPSDAKSIDLGAYFADPAVPDNTVFMQTTLGTLPIQLTPVATPITVANFLNYVRSGRYANTFFHRSVSHFIVQGGGFGINAANSIVPVQTDPAIVNEYSPSRLNTRGTIAMAKTDDPNSATSQFFFNLSNNSSSLNNTQNSGGFTVFGHVVGDAGLAVMDAIAAVPPQDASFIAPVFAELPLIGYQDGQDTLRLNQFIYVNDVTEGAAYTVTSDNPAVVAAAVRGKQLLYTPLAAGTAHVTVTATGLDGQPVSQTLTVTVGGSGNYDDGGGVHVDPPPAAVVTLGKGAKKSVTFKDRSGATATITISGPGKATVQFDGSNASVKDGKGAATVTGGNLTLRSIALTGTTAATVVKVTANKANAVINLGGLTAAGALGTFNARNVVLDGHVQVGGAIKSLTVKAALATLTAGAVGNVTVGGTLAGTWKVTSVKSVSANAIAGATLATTARGNSMGAVSARMVVNSQIRSAGNIASLIVTGSMTGSQVFAGVPADGAVTADDAARGNGQILLAKVGRGPKGRAFANSAIAARTIRTATFGNWVDAGGTSPLYGVEADSIRTLTGFLGGKPFAIKNATTQAQADAQLDKAKVSPKNVRMAVI